MRGFQSGTFVENNETDLLHFDKAMDEGIQEDLSDSDLTVKAWGSPWYETYLMRTYHNANILKYIIPNSLFTPSINTISAGKYASLIARELSGHNMMLLLCKSNRWT